MKFLSISKARSKLPDLLGSLERVALTRNGEPVAVLLNIDDYRALKTMQRLAVQPGRLASIIHKHERVQAGHLEGFPELGEGWEEMVSGIGEVSRRYGDEDPRKTMPEVAEVGESRRDYDDPAAPAAGPGPRLEEIRGAFDRLFEDARRLGDELERARKAAETDEEESASA